VRHAGFDGQNRCMTIADDRICSIGACREPAVDSDQDEVGPWLVTIFYCAEHARERDEGTPLGAAGVDTSRVLVEPVSGSEPQSGGRMPAPA
jgi:hypothetical protein